MTIHGHPISENEDLTICHPDNVWKKKTLKRGTFVIRDLYEPIFVNGRLVYKVPDLNEIRRYSQQELSHLWDEYFRFEYPQVYKVDLTEELLKMKLDLIEEMKH